MSIKEEPKIEPEKVELSQADNIILTLSEMYGKRFNVILRCTPDLESGKVNVELFDSSKVYEEYNEE